MTVSEEVQLFHILRVESFIRFYFVGQKLLSYSMLDGDILGLHNFKTVEAREKAVSLIRDFAKYKCE